MSFLSNGSGGGGGTPGADGDSAYEVAVAEGFVGDEAAWLASLMGADGADGVTVGQWAYYATQWTTEPSFNSTIGAGDVYNYTLDGTTRYRLVPSPYDSEDDAFYTTFSMGTLSGLIVSRG